MPASASKTRSPERGPAVDGVRLAIHDDLAAVERDWRAFEKIADGTVFQSFDWVSLWQHHIGRRNGVQPIVVTGHDRHGTNALSSAARASSTAAWRAG